jgi:hypothetical protein
LAAGHGLDEENYPFVLVGSVAKHINSPDVQMWSGPRPPTGTVACAARIPHRRNGGTGKLGGSSASYIENSLATIITATCLQRLLGSNEDQATLTRWALQSQFGKLTPAIALGRKTADEKQHAKSELDENGGASPGSKESPKEHSQNHPSESRRYPY